MPKPRKSRSHRSQVAAKLTGPGSSASGAGPSQLSANSTTINYTAMPTETLRFMLSQRHLNQTGPRRVLITRLQESDSPTTNTAPQVPDRLAAMIASIMEAKLANLNGSRSTSGWEKRALLSHSRPPPNVPKSPASIDGLMLSPYTPLLFCIPTPPAGLT